MERLMKKLLKTTKKLEVKTETVRNLTDKQLEHVAGGNIVSVTSNYDTAKCNVYGVH